MGLFNTPTFSVQASLMISDLVIGMAGAGGDGIVSAGESLIAAAAREGYYAILTKSFGSQIRGGESSCRLRLSAEPILSAGGTLQVAVALNWEDFLKFGGELPVGSETVVIYEEATGVAPGQIPLDRPRPALAVPAPIARMAQETAGTLKAKNTVVLGLLSGWFGLAGESIRSGMRRKFAGKGAEVQAGNDRAFQAGLDYAAQHPLGSGSRRLPPPAHRKPKLLTDGNDMCGAAAIFAGCEFFGGYPITPSSEIMQFLNREIWKHGGVLLQAEDEIAGLGAVVGASFAGKKAMTATSGPGLSLKGEMLGLATIAELPLVCVDVQRGGPSTGLPTKSEQSDLWAAAFSAHGDVVRPVLAPITVADVFPVTVEAFNIAEQFQTPVIVLSDQELAQRKETIDPIDTARLQRIERRRPAAADLDPYVRYRITPDGISPISHPGMPGGNHLASGIEHNENGAPSANGAVHARMNEKRIRKLAPLGDRDDLFTREGPPDAPIGVIGWGSTAGPLIEAARNLQREGLAVQALAPRLLYPVAEKVYRRFFASLRVCLVVEQSHLAQLYRLIRMFVDLPCPCHSLARSGANPFSPEEIAGQIRSLAGLDPAAVPSTPAPTR